MTMPLALLTTGADDRWYPGIGDPTPMGFITVAAYLFAAWVCFRAYRAEARRAVVGIIEREARRDERLLSMFWLGLFCMLLFLGLNKQLDLQTLLTQTARDLSKAQGWYYDRRPVQLLFIALVGLAGVSASVGLAYALRKVIGRVWLAVLGIAELMVFIVVRAASFHHVDQLLFTGTVRLNWVLELSGISLIAIAAWRAASAASREAQPPT
jgi:hypothetical protein